MSAGDAPTANDNHSQRTLLIDGNNLAVRACYAMAKSPLEVHGVRTGPLLVAINSLSRHLTEEQPHRAVFCWDSPSQRRLALQADYKGNREQHQDVDRSKTDTFALLQEFLSLAGIPQDKQEDCEADDLVATYWRSIRRQPASIPWHTTILSSDKDFLMLLDDDPSHLTDQVRLSSANTPTDRWDTQKVRDVHGCEPYMLRYAMAMAGDHADNVHGVPRIGMKTAIKLLSKHDWSFEAVLDDPRVSPYADLVRGNLALVDLLDPNETDRTAHALPPPLDLGEGCERLIPFLQRLELRSVLDKLDKGILWFTP